MVEELSKKLELKPCPWCGDSPVVTSVGKNVRVECVGIGCAVRPVTGLYVGMGAVRAWNERKGEGQPQGLPQQGEGAG